LEQRSYASLTEITDTINRFQPTPPIQRLGFSGASQRRDLR